ncbi:glycosyltransferase [PVC group bacterium]|nr:glycosyltransferase [PVC group bacterium]
MINKKKIVVIMPAFNAAQTLKNTFKDIPHDLVDQIILTDDGSIDKTALIA